MATLVSIQSLTKHFPVERGILSAISSRLLRRQQKVVHAVCNADLDIQEGETMGLVGESGSGKSTLGRCVLRLLERSEGTVHFSGVNLTALEKKALRRTRKEMQIVFQDPFTSLNPRATVRQIVGHPMELHGLAQGGKETKERVVGLLKDVGLTAEHADRYPHQFSGGQKQRIAIARALAVTPKFIVADEPVSALDVSVQAQILNLLRELKGKYKLTYLFISHDLSVVRQVSDRVAVMYLGKIVETGKSEDIFREPSHPYTQALLSAVPIPDPLRKKDRIVLKGDIPSSIDPPSGCRFHTRCPYAMEVCRRVEPAMTDLGGGHSAACHLLYHDGEGLGAVRTEARLNYR